MIPEMLALFLQDFGVPCTCNGVPFVGILDTPDQQITLGRVTALSTMYALLIRSADVAAASIVSGASITADGRAYIVRDVVLQDDGAFSSLTLTAA